MLRYEITKVLRKVLGLAETYSNLMRELKSKKFVFTGELETTKTTDFSDIINEARELLGYVTACNVTDNAGSFAAMSSLVASYIVQRETGMECIFQLRCTDRNRIALTSDLLGAAALGIKNVLALTGDHTLVGDMPNAKPVYDLDGTLLTMMIRKMVDEGVDLEGNPIAGPRPRFHVGVAANPNASPLEPELIKIIRKIDVGAEFIQTQVCFNIDRTLEFLRMLKSFKIPVLIGIFPMKSYGVARGFNELIPGVRVPEDLLEKLKKVKDEATSKEEKSELYDKVNLEFFVPFVKELKESGLCAGCHIMSVHYTKLIPKLLREAGLIKEEAPLEASAVEVKR
ncbi:MAG: methylenetetrahydrofolate reductase [Candidatus Bathyarchaeia archaeon]